jgi:hypothetical protein
LAEDIVIPSDVEENELPNPNISRIKKGKTLKFRYNTVA